MNEKKFINETIILPNVRLSYPALFTPKAGMVGSDGKAGEPRYSAMLIADPDSDAVKRMVAAAIKVASDKWGPDNARKILAALRTQKGLCWGKGEERPNRDGETPAELEGKVWINTGRPAKKGPPLVVDRDPSVHLQEADGKIYGGCYVNAKVNVWPLDMPKVQRRIVATIESVQFFRDGDAFGGGRAPDASGFDDVTEGADDDEGFCVSEDDDIPF